MKTIKEKALMIMILIISLLVVIVVYQATEIKSTKKELEYTNLLMKEKQGLIDSYARIYSRDNNEVEKAQAEAEYWMNLYLDLEDKDYEFGE